MIYLKPRFLPFLGPVLLGLCLSCATEKPVAQPSPTPVVPPGEPRLSLSFDRLEAAGPQALTLYFELNAENPRSSAARLSLKQGHLTLDDRETGGEIHVAMAEGELGPHSSAVFPVIFTLEKQTQLLPVLSGQDGAESPEQGRPDFDETRARAALDLVFAFSNGDTVEAETAAATIFPRIREPEFAIVSIAVLKGDLINTRFKVKLRMTNPNVFPVDLSSFTYALYGAGRLWAEGMESNALTIPAKGSRETELTILMNFINMRRELLDQIAALRQVRYRFAGEAELATGIEYLPEFRYHFDLSGNTAVLE
ncbi:hypothetical protein FACS189468_3410 [Spirochaetia bacterium]|nr:hypothetical protein FACS189468_3410 [Spirochaetia bacterium]